MSAPVRFPVLDSARLLTPPLARNEIHLWAARLDLEAERVATLAGTLSEDERERADRFRLTRHRRRFQAAWGLARSLLSGYLHTAPERIELRYGPHGKPDLDRPSSDLQFNLSHSGEQLVVAVRHRRRLGVDVERLRAIDEAQRIALRYFSRREIESLEALPASERLQGFFNCWTRKEALVKALGEGVFVALDRFDVSLAPREPARLLALDGEAEAAATWSLFHLEPAPGVVGALATEDGAALRLRAWTVEPGRQLLPGVD